MWYVLLIQIDISSMCQQLEVGLLLTEEKHRAKRKNGSSVSSDETGRTISLSGTIQEKCVNDVFSVLLSYCTDAVYVSTLVHSTSD